MGAIVDTAAGISGSVVSFAKACEGHRRCL